MIPGGSFEIKEKDKYRQHSLHDYQLFVLFTTSMFARDDLENLLSHYFVE